MSNISNRNIVIAMYGALNAGDGAGYFSHMNEDVRMTSIGDHTFSGTLVGKPEIMRNLVKPFREKLDGPLKLHLQNIVAEGDQVVVEAKGEAKAKNGRAYNNQYCFILKLKDGMVSEIREYMDTSLTNDVFGSVCDVEAAFQS